MIELLCFLAISNWFKSKRNEGLQQIIALDNGQLKPRKRFSRYLPEAVECPEQKFGFRFVVFVNRRSKEAIVPMLEARLRGSRDEERRTALREILAIAEDRLKREG